VSRRGNVKVASVVSLVEQGGAQLGMLQVARALRTFGYETRMIGGHNTKGGLAMFSHHGFRAEVMGDAPDLQYACRRDYAEWLRPRLRSADLVHAHMFGSWWAAAQVLPANVPLVASEHNAIVWPGESHDDEMREALRRVDVFLAHGPDAFDYVLSLGLPLERLRRGRVPVTGFDTAPRARLPSPRIVYAGRLNWDKGIDVLIEGLALVDPCPPAFILGTGPIEGILRSRAAELGIADTVHFVGWQDDPAEWIVGASVCVVPSRHDAWSQTAVLAMGLGVPVVGTAVEGLPDVLAGRRGLLVPAEDPVALATGISDVLCGKVGVDLAGAREYARQFSPDTVSRDYSDVYRQAIRHRNRASKPTAEL
jgi:glycosyltransferase involved in cell wall biosynthesis